ncbi:MAG TPA: lysophospholipid acyltransferase family protein [Pyrinomonadaceae bacterium]|jgi:KDO2-lipid IV(A) lauroyltransferase|nr:lysophospholipid acyltransferase family protein [Pyrinomonadaceae bacterium]
MAKQRAKLQTYLEYAAVRALLGVLGLLPLRAAVALGRGTGHAAYALAGGLRRTGLRNLRLAFPEMGEAERRRTLRRSMVGLGRQLGYFSHFPRMTAEDLRGLVEYDGIEILHEAQARGRGIIFLTAHLGAWEVLSFAHSALYNPISFMVRRLDNPRVEELTDRVRTRFGNRSIDKKMAARSALKLLREGGTLGILADLNTQPHEGVFVPFFGRPACTTSGIAVLALRTDASVIPVVAPWHEERGRYVFHGSPIVELVRTGDHESDVEVNTARFTAAVEAQIRKYPDQWLWIHKRWKTRPAGEPDLYGKELVKEFTESSSTPSQDTLFSAKPQKF